jgi:DNA-binding transcriptional LysR family regulator
MMAAHDLDSGRLIQPFDISFTVNNGYYMLTSPIQSQDPRIQAFRNWVMGIGD